MSLFQDRWPWSNIHELNLDWILLRLTKLEKDVYDFVALNALKYADPIQWNITTQYEKNTIVIDPLTGTAYISVQPVPSGVALTNTDYWTPVFDLSSFIARAGQNFTVHYEADTTLAATFNSNAEDWLVWGDVLYKVLVNITAGDQYVVGSNIEHFTMEDIIGHLDDLQTQGKDSLIQAINECVNAININTTNIGTLVAAIGDLDNLSTQTKTDIVSAINEIVYSFNLFVIDINDAINKITFRQSNVISKAIFFGDSITAGDLGDGTIANPTYPQSYGTIANVDTTNMGRGGSTAANNPNAGSAEHLNYVATLVNFADYDQCFVCHGVNDYNASSPLGGINSTDEYTYMGALQKFIETALAQNPTIQIIILGTFWSSHSHVVNNLFVDYLPANSVGCTIADYINGARNVANKYGLPFIDMMDIMGVNSKNYQYFTIDGIHPLQSSYTMIGILLAKSLTFPQSDGYEQQIAAAKTLNTNMVCVGDIDQYAGDFPNRYMKKGLTTMFNASNSYWTSSRRPFTVVSGEPIAFHAIAYVSPGANFYIRLTMGANTCTLWAYQNQTNDNQCFEVNTVATPNFTGDAVIEAKIDALDGTLDTETVYLTDIVINKGIIPDRGGIGSYTEEFTWFTINGLQTGVSYPTGMACEFMIDRMGNVRFRGRLIIDLDNFTGTKIAEVPLSFRPQKTVVIPCARYGTSTTMYNIQVSDTGNLSFSAAAPSGSGNVTIDLSAISYNIMKQTVTIWPY